MIASSRSVRYVDLPALAPVTQFVVRESPAEYGEPSTNFGIPEARAVDALLKSLHAIGNEVKLEFLQALRILNDGNLCIELGFSSLQQYCDREFGIARSTVFLYLRVAKALDGLPRLRVLFRQGELSWQQTREISRVATADTEIQWIEFAVSQPVRELEAEVREAWRTGRDAPREKRYGLPNLTVRLSFDVTLEQKERVLAALALVSEGLGDERGSRSVLVRWADGILSGAIPAAPVAEGRREAGRADRPTPAQTILYRACPDCREATVETRDGLVSVTPERVAELAPESTRVDIAPDEELVAETMPAGEVDKPNTARMTRQVLSRDGLRCGNPGCDNRLNLNAHHIVFRSRSGRTMLFNEAAVCDLCHALLHGGRLDVSGSPGDGLVWKPRPVDPNVKLRNVESLRSRLREMTSTVPSPKQQSTAVDSRRLRFAPRATLTPEQSTAVDSPSRVRDLAEGLVRLGGTRTESEQRVRAAFQALAAETRASLGPDQIPEPPNDEAVLRRALVS